MNIMYAEGKDCMKIFCEFSKDHALKKNNLEKK